MDYIPNKKWITIDVNNQMRHKCETLQFPLSEIDLEHINKMIKYIDESYAGNAAKYGIRAGIGIAANQIGYQKRMFYIHLDDEQKNEHKYFLINPTVISLSAQKAYLAKGEGCLSVPNDHQGLVIRHAKIKVQGFDYFKQKTIEVVGTGLLGMCLQHELDHLDGKLYYDRINPITPFFANEQWHKI